MYVTGAATQKWRVQFANLGYPNVHNARGESDQIQRKCVGHYYSQKI